MRGAVVLVVALAASGLGACGGDDDGGSSGTDSAQAPAGQEGAPDGSRSESQGDSGGSNESGAAGSDKGTGAGGTGGNGDGSGNSAGGGSGDGERGESPSLDLDDKAPAPKVGGKDRGKPPDVGGSPKSERDFSGVARQVYETSRYFCRQAGVEGMRKEYGIKSDDPEDIAREAAQRNQPRGFPEAVYFGCLEGLRQPS